MFKSSRFLMRYSCGTLKPNQTCFQSSRKMVEKVSSKAGSKEVSKSVAEYPKKKKTKGPVKHPNKECFTNPCCPDAHSKYDQDFAHLLEHKKRTVFEKTWKDCPEPRKVEKIVCADIIPESTRESVDKKKPALPADQCSTQSKKCPKVRMPGCKPPMERWYCKQFFGPADCEKIKCPYPAFSECQSQRPKPLRDVECNCLRVGALCEYTKILKEKGKLNRHKKQK